jgi:hypothetical protein
MKRAQVPTIGCRAIDGGNGGDGGDGGGNTVHIYLRASLSAMKPVTKLVRVKK